LRLVEDHQPAERPQGQVWILQPAPIRLVLEIEIEELPLPAEHAGERRLAALPRSEQRRDRGATQSGDEVAERQRAIDHGDYTIIENPERESEFSRMSGRKPGTDLRHA